MEITNPIGQFYLSLIARLKAAAPSLRYIGADLGQMENYPSGGKPPVSFPAVLFDVDETAYEEMSQLAQTGESILIIRICQPAYNGLIDSLKPDAINQQAMDYLNTEQEVYLALQGWSSATISTMVRKSTKTEKRNDEYRVRVMRFSFGSEDYTAGNQISVAVPDMSLYQSFIPAP